ncbi:MAG: hypothetical protein WB801_00955 [Candidatus Dormiibacterota bacterium]
MTNSPVKMARAKGLHVPIRTPAIRPSGTSTAAITPPALIAARSR